MYYLTTALLAVAVLCTSCNNEPKSFDYGPGIDGKENQGDTYQVKQKNSKKN